MVIKIYLFVLIIISNFFFEDKSMLSADSGSKVKVSEEKIIIIELVKIRYKKDVRNFLHYKATPLFVESEKTKLQFIESKYYQL